MPRTKKDKQHQLAVAARERIATIIDQVPPLDLVNSIKRAPSLRGMILGYIAEDMFQRHVLERLSQIGDLVKHDDHNRMKNKSDRDFSYKGEATACS